MNDSDSEIKSSVSAIIPMERRDILRVVIFGAIASAVAAVVYVLFDKFVFSMLLCNDEASSACVNSSQYAAMVAMALAAIVGLVLLSRARIYRPLFVILATIIALWGIHIFAAALPWYWGLAGVIVVGTAAFTLFTWLARIRSFILSLIITIVLVVVARLILMS